MFARHSRRSLTQNGAFGRFEGRRFWRPRGKACFDIRQLVYSTWPLRLLESSIWPLSCRPDTPSPRFGGRQVPTKHISPPRLSHRVPDRHVVLVHRQFSGAYRLKRHLGRVSGPSGVVGKHGFNNADRISEFQTRRPGCSQCDPVGRTGTRSTIPKLNFRRAESLLPFWTLINYQEPAVRASWKRSENALAVLLSAVSNSGYTGQTVDE
jgi:hypothetical protein